MNRVLRADGVTPQPQESAGASMEWLVDGSVVAGAGLSLARMTVQGGAICQQHRHPNCDEAVHLLSGELLLVIEDQPQFLKPGATAFITAGQVHHVENPSVDPAVVMLAYSAGVRVFEPLKEQP